MSRRERAALLFSLALNLLGGLLYVQRTEGTPRAALVRPAIIESAQAATVDRVLQTPAR